MGAGAWIKRGKIHELACTSRDFGGSSSEVIHQSLLLKAGRQTFGGHFTIGLFADAIVLFDQVHPEVLLLGHAGRMVNNHDGAEDAGCEAVAL
jgi:hypothetical protein